MPDIQTAWDAGTMAGAWRLDGGALARDGDLATAVIISLFSWRRAAPDDTLPEDDPDPQGWWGDSFPRQPQAGEDRLGSRLWLLRREKILPATLERIRQVCREALQWLIEDKVARAVEIEVERQGLDRVDIRVTVLRPDGRRWEGRYDWAWRG